MLQELKLCLGVALASTWLVKSQPTKWIAATGTELQFDVAVYGATPGGIASAISALETGFSPREYTVALINPSGHVGEMVSGGLGHTDIGDPKIVGGIAADFFRQVCNGSTADASLAANSKSCYDFPPSWAENAFNRMLSQAAGARLTVLQRHRIVSATRAPNDATRFRAKPTYNQDGLRASPSEAHDSSELGSAGKPIDCIQLVQQTGVLSDPAQVAIDEQNALQSNQVVNLCAKMFIDASYEGDLAAAAGADLAFGREGQSDFGEDMAGMLSDQLESTYGNPSNQFHKPINGTSPDGSTLPLLYDGPLSSPGDADNHTMAYNYRMCLARKSAGKSTPLPLPPSGYDPAHWELLRRYIATLDPSTADQLSSYIRVQWLDPTAPDKSDVNNNGPITTDFSQGSWDYPAFNWTRRREIIRAHIDYTAGLLHFLSYDPSVPSAVKGAMAGLGLPTDEFQDDSETGIKGWPYQLYVREANRLQGQYIFVQMDRSDPSRFKKNSTIGCVSYNIDVHHGVRYIRKDSEGVPGNTGIGGGASPTVWNEGNFDRWHELGPADIPYEILVPRDDGEQPSNLLVPVSPSSTHVGLGCLRLEPQYMIMGQASGTAAVLALDEAARLQQKQQYQKQTHHVGGVMVPVQRINITELQERLVSHGQIIHF